MLSSELATLDTGSILGETAAALQDSSETVQQPAFPGDLLTSELTSFVRHSRAGSLSVAGISSMLEPDYRSISADYGRASLGMNGFQASGGASYTTLTPLQPLPPISTVSDKFRHDPNVGSGFPFMNGINGSNLGMSSPYEPYSTMNMGVGVGGGMGTNAVLNGYGQSVGMGGYPSPHHGTCSPADSRYTPTSYMNGYDHFSAQTGSPHHHHMRSHTQRPGLANPMVINGFSSHPTSISPSTPMRDRSSNKEMVSNGEEVNTKEVASRVTSELKRYSIPQAVFAQRVLCRSQGTLSDLLRNPKPWSKLKSGRETFRRMWKWLQEPEFQRMSTLRLAHVKRKKMMLKRPHRTIMSRNHVLYSLIYNEEHFTQFSKRTRGHQRKCR
ncbi:One cut domain family member 2 [Holothuria leucospilota]|uniref:One cut domain family member 2 n=1 Tax=Holothuria leucospilota TaxID=206669 RepID=A0A9Q1CSQ3_HOLLE|nr:One cut domain family member 2 [Holothuria leucospilota]